MNNQIVVIKRNSYFDSVTLMSLGNKVRSASGADEVVVVMATEMNREILRQVGLGNADTDAASVNDLIIAVRGGTADICKQALALAEEGLAKGSGSASTAGAPEFRTLRHAVDNCPDANLAVISVPGAYAAREARTALRSGLHVMMFSDNVSVEDEKSLKELAASKGLLMMGPDCGTALINGAGLCFSNAVREGAVGIVGASGTGIQEVMVQIDRLGGGIYQALGTGGRDLSEAIGGIMMVQGAKALLEDENCGVLLMVSKPPAKSVEERIFALLDVSTKPVVVCFLDGDTTRKCRPGICIVDNLLDAARKATALAGIAPDESGESARTTILEQEIQAAKKILQPQQRFARGLYCGGTLCAEAISVLRERLGGVKSNVSHRPGEELGDEPLRGTVLLDMGDDQFTNGKPHPMIEPSLRNETIVQQAADPQVGVILLDFELGFGSHGDPAGETVGAIRAARQMAGESGRQVVFVGYLCGTAKDYQDKSAQAELLRREGVILTSSNVEAAQVTAAILS